MEDMTSYTEYAARMRSAMANGVTPEEGVKALLDSQEFTPEQAQYIVRLASASPGTPTHLTGALNGITDTATFGLAKKARAGITAAMDPNVNYDQAMAQEDSWAQAYRDESPNAAAVASGTGAALPLALEGLAAPFTGGASLAAMPETMAATMGRTALGMPRNASVLGNFSTKAMGRLPDQMLTGGVLGGTYGAMAGAGASPEPDQAEGATNGAVLGGLAGAAFPPAMAAAGKAVGSLREALTGLRAYAESVVGGGAAPAARAPLGAPQMPAAGPAPSSPSMAQAQVLAALQRQGLAPEQVPQALQAARAQNVPMVAADLGESMRRPVRNAVTLPGEANQMVADRIGDRQRDQPARLSEALTALGLPPRPMGGQEMARQGQEQYNALLTPGVRQQPVTGPGPLQALQAPAARDAVEAQRRELLRTADPAVPPQLYGEDGGFVRPPTVNDLDVAQRAVGDEAAVPMSGKTGTTVAAYGSLQDRLTTGTGVPEYEAARAFYHSGKSRERAFDVGKSATGITSPEELLSQLDSREPEVMDAFAAGLAESARKRLGGINTLSGVADATKSIFGTAPQRTLWREVLGHERFDRLSTIVNLELAGSRTAQKVLTGSNTGERMADSLDEVVQGELLRPKSTGERLMGWAAAAKDAFTQGRSEAARTEVADVLTSPDLRRVDAFFETLRQMEAQRLARQTTRSRATSAAAATGSRAEADRRR